MSGPPTYPNPNLAPQPVPRPLNIMEDFYKKLQCALNNPVDSNPNFRWIANGLTPDIIDRIVNGTTDQQTVDYIISRTMFVH